MKFYLKFEDGHLVESTAWLTLSEHLKLAVLLQQQDWTKINTKSHKNKKNNKNYEKCNRAQKTTTISAFCPAHRFLQFARAKGRSLMKEIECTHFLFISHAILSELQVIAMQLKYERTHKNYLGWDSSQITPPCKILMKLIILIDSPYSWSVFIGGFFRTGMLFRVVRIILVAK